MTRLFPTAMLPTAVTRPTKSWVILVKTTPFGTPPPSTTSKLPVAELTPTDSAAPKKFTVELPATVTELFDELFPIVKPPLQTVALVMVSALKPAPVEPTVINPALVTVTPVVPPPTVKRLLLALAAPPTVRAPALNR